MKIKSITIFCGSSSGAKPMYEQEAFQFGQMLAGNNIRVVYGGAKIGVMGAVANGALSAGGEVIGVIPGFLCSKEIAHDQLTSLEVVKTMHERKTRMNELCDAVVALSGGFGTMEELFEMLTWGQLGLHRKPIGLLNTGGFFDHLVQFREHMYEEQFISDIHRKMMMVSDDSSDLLSKLESYIPPALPEWLKAQNT